eukprot:Opistho-2@40865
MAETGTPKKELIPLRVMFVHSGNARTHADGIHMPISEYIMRTFIGHVEPMDTQNHDECLQRQLHAIEIFKPQVVVGHSFGAALVMEMLQKGQWKGPTVLLCPAVHPGHDNLSLPSTVPIIVVQGEEDAIVSPLVAEQIAKTNSDNPALRLLEIEDDHKLLKLLDESSVISFPSIILMSIEKTAEIAGYEGPDLLSFIAEAQVKFEGQHDSSSSCVVM